jgi:hypothetical protein
MVIVCVCGAMLMLKLCRVGKGLVRLLKEF